jgi:RNA-directed DNA polymerase
MMHENEKSDSAIIATKPADKAGQPAAEQVERRAGTGRDADQQRTCRAQNRQRVTGAGPRATSRNDLLPVAKYSR